MQKVPDPSVVEWLDQQPAESVWITSITLFEARLGLALPPNGRRRQALELAFEQLLAEDLEERVLDFDRSAAEAAAGLAAERQGERFILPPVLTMERGLISDGSNRRGRRDR